MRLLRRFAFVALTLSLSGCLIQQDPPTPQNQVSDAIRYNGLITMLELRFLNQGAAAVMAGFNKLVDDNSAPARVFPRLDRHALDRVSFAPWSQFAFVDPRQVDRGGQCRKITMARPDARAVSKAQKIGDPISLGKLQFGLNHQNIFTPMGVDSGLNYYLQLNAPVPAGEYVIRAEGNKSLAVKPFEVSFAMPEEFTGIRLNDGYIDRPGVEFSRSQPLRIQWDALSIPNDQSAIGLVLISEDVTTRHILTCAGLESDVAAYDAHGNPTWTIDPSWLSDLFEGDGTQIYITREFLTQAEGSGLHIDLESIRKWMSIAIVRN